MWWQSKWGAGDCNAGVKPFIFFKLHKRLEEIKLANLKDMRTNEVIMMQKNFFYERQQREREWKGKEGESIMWLLFSTSSLVHVLSITPASLFLPYLQHTYLPCQQHARQINRKYTHAYKHTGISASNIPAPNWPKYNTLLLIQSELPPEAIFQLNQKKALAGRPLPLCVELDE